MKEILLTQQFCLNCNHQEKYHNPPVNDPLAIQCMGWSAWNEGMSYGVVGAGTTMTRCKCKEFKMDNLKYLEQYNAQRQNKV